MNRRQHGQRGFTLFELIVVISIISILSGVALTKYFGLLVDVERTSMEQNLGAMRSAVALQMLDHIAKDDMPGVVAMADTNPMSYMVQTPGNYLGALDHPDPAKIAGGTGITIKKKKCSCTGSNTARIFKRLWPGRHGRSSKFPSPIRTSIMTADSIPALIPLKAFW